MSLRIWPIMRPWSRPSDFHAFRTSRPCKRPHADSSRPSAHRLLDASVRMHQGRRRRVKRAAIDSTGLECSAASGYFIRRRTRVAGPWKTVVYHHYPKLGVVCDTDCHFILAAHAGRGPRPDIDEFQPLLSQAMSRVRLLQMTADAGYDSEPNHRFARDRHGVRTIIPAKHGRPTEKLPSGPYRRLMKQRFDRPAYRHRTQVETVISMIKRRQGPHVHGRSYHSQCRDLRLLVLTHNVMILVIVWVFYRAGQNYLSGLPDVFRGRPRGRMVRSSSSDH